ncbi:hypothetical protein H4R99_006613 [Coemansia sp. RSA 1722]|nr:hypothetical protein LPJ57_005094 [Coemansia sp. RSA 486]KAJ1878583.1 hypothetical protein LPJ57_003328 [Coemansia sp. RSA 486]KAJ2233561.1 hypothetical protein IWW45_004083 [Coemansia sp. RSA 485]KAJ2591842.1 hypothetical protein H4R99_006613 [Coemansia sp. RSA 1722]KAJ2697379.1 hypothetical protein FB645_005936 [Coemansia sp. IMI 203386]
MATVREFSAKILKRLETKHPLTSFKVTAIGNKWRPGKYSLRQQADMRKACLINGVDPKSIGMPEKPVKKVKQSKPPKGHKQQRMYAQKQAAIEKNLQDMPEKIRKWKEGLAAEKAKTKSSLPF